MINKYYNVIGQRGVKNSSLDQEICNSPDKRKYLISKKNSKFTRTCKLLPTGCPLSPFSSAKGPGLGQTKFSSVGTFFTMCKHKQKEVAYWDSTKNKNVLKHPQCKTCKQGKASQIGRIVVVLNEIGIVIDEDMVAEVIANRAGREE